MKLIVSQSDLSTNLALVSRAVPSKPTHPVLGCIHAIASQENQTMTLTSFDLSLGIKVTFAAQVKEGGALALPAALIKEVISRLPDGELNLSVKDDEGFLTLIIKPSKGKYEVRALEADEYPELPEAGGESVEIGTASLIEGLRGTIFSSSTDETKQVLTGVRITIDANSMEFAATDGHRLSVISCSNECDRNPMALTIPSKALKELLTLLGKDDSVKVRLDDGQAVFELDNKVLTTRTLQGDYPQYQQLMPKQFSRMITCDRRHLISVCERVSLLATDKAIVKFTISDEGIELSSENSSGRGRETVSATVSGDAIVMAFNSKYLLEGLKNMPGQEVTIRINEPLLPVIFEPISDLKMRYLAMPIQIRD